MPPECVSPAAGPTGPAVREKANSGVLLRVKLDDQILLNGSRDAVTRRNPGHPPGEGLLIHFEPVGELTPLPDSFQRRQDRNHAAALFPDADDVTGTDLVGRYVHDLSVHGDMTVPDQLARRGA